MDLNINPHDICRICMTEKSQTNHLINYFKVIVKDGYRFFVPDMVLKCLNIESDPNDGLPDKICDACEKEITNFHLFKEKSARTEQILLAAFNRPQRNKEPSKPSANTIATQTTKDNLSCVECNTTFKTENLLFDHFNHGHSGVKTDAGSQTEEFDLSVDDGIFEEIPESVDIDFKRDLKIEAGFELDDDIEEVQMNVDMEDDFSEQPMDDPIDFEIEFKPQQEYQCGDCLSAFTKIDAWRNHKCVNKVIVHVVDQSFDAPECDELGEDCYEELILEDESFECVQCHEKFTNIEEYTIHCENNSKLIEDYYQIVRRGI